LVSNNEQRGSLFTKQLGAIVGNVRNTKDKEETVLGFFQVSGVTEARAFFRSEDFDIRFPSPKSKYPCSEIQEVYITTPDSMRFYIDRGYEVVFADYCDTSNVQLNCNLSFEAWFAPKYCTDCRFRGTSEKPDFWIF
jgi:hypothetical protein